MRESLRPPIWLAAAAFIEVAEGIALIAWAGASPLTLSAFFVALVAAGLLIAGSRVIWILLFCNGATQLLAPFVTDGPVWSLALASATLLCLLVPPSRRYVWQRKARSRGFGRNLDSSAARAIGRLRACVFALSARITGRNDLPIPNRVLVWRLVLTYLIMIPIVDRLEGLSDGDLLGAVVWHVVWSCFNLLQLSIALLLLLSVIRYFDKRFTADPTTGAPSPHA